MAFKLSIVNAPLFSRYWWAEYNRGMYPIVSGWLDLDEVWNCPYGAYGATDLHILVVDSNYSTRHAKSNLGPVDDGEDYIYDCHTEVLSKLFAGTITTQKLKYDGDYQDIPATNIPIGVEGQVHIWGRNDTPVFQDLRIEWIVKDPDGYIVQSYSDWSYNHGPNADHHFIGPRFDIGKSGIWTIKVDLLMNTDNPVIVDSYDGNLCSIAEEFVGSIARKELEYDETRGAIPVY